MITDELVELLIEKRLKIATAESCTGGLIAEMITSVAGASAVFGCGIIAYSNDIKKSVLGVKAETLDGFGAVSEQTAAEMAAGARIISGSDLAVSVTGIAGPGGGSDQKPVGTVCIGVSTAFGIDTKRFLFKGDRRSVRLQSAEAAIKMVIDVLKTI
ncbi:MAG: damage-inducible protein CinA [Firmicutes bacterium HGW-Firmicutes-21]|nr:MAG: damage-inducible protein CinA [Firmicutes bacterium HGW-Firmicutes-21]